MALLAFATALLVGESAAAGAAEDIEFVAEHLPEVAMDNRYATLPVWDAATDGGRKWSFATQAGLTTTRTGNLKIAGPLFAAAVSRRLSSRLQLTTFGFLDTLTLSGARDVRPLQTLFSPGTPLQRPVDARFDDLDGRMRHYGAGLSVVMSAENRWLGAHRIIGGLLWQRVSLRDYRLRYEVLDGEAAGVRGDIDFDAHYTHVAPFAGLELPRHWTRWALSPHALLAWPLPRRGIVGHITGPGFDLRGDTEEIGAGKHFGDPSLTLGVGVTYLPAHLTFDAGTLVIQRFVEPYIHKGIESNWLLSIEWRY